MRHRLLCTRRGRRPARRRRVRRAPERRAVHRGPRRRRRHGHGGAATGATATGTGTRRHGGPATAAGDTSGGGGGGGGGAPAAAGGGGAEAGRGARAACSPQHTDAPGVTDTEIKLGNVSTISGPVPNFGATGRAGAKAYLDYVNSQGGVCGRKLTPVRTATTASTPASTGPRPSR